VRNSSSQTAAAAVPGVVKRICNGVQIHNLSYVIAVIIPMEKSSRSTNQLTKKLTEPEVSLSCSQESTTDRFSEPHETYNSLFFIMHVTPVIPFTSNGLVFSVCQTKILFPFLISSIYN
jgi:hypothetical protein